MVPRKTKEGRPLKLVLEWWLKHSITDAEIAAALNKPAATFSRRKDADNFPTFAELDSIGDHFGVNPRWLQVEFGFIDEGELRSKPQAKSARTKP